MLRRNGRSQTDPDPGADASGHERAAAPARLHQLIAREKARTDRTGQEFSLVLFRCSLESGPPPAWLVRGVRQRARLSDEVEVHGEHVCALLIATRQPGAYQFAEAMVASLGVNAAFVKVGVYTYPWHQLTSITESGDHDDSEPPTLRPPDSDGRRPGNGHKGNGASGSRNGHHLDPREAAETRPVRLGDLLQNRRATRLRLASQYESSRLPPELDLCRPLPLWKRATDVVGAGIALLLLSPLMLGLAFAVRLSSRGPVIFSQVRAGADGRPFVLYKFRTMRTDAEALKAELRQFSEQDGPAFKLKHDPRVTKLGGFLRKTSLDELPQLWNVLKGDMSLVGPRPLPLEEACACELWHSRRLEVAPGMTCIWQVKGRSRVSFADWMRMDILYIRTRSFLGDLRLLLLTIPAVIFRRGAS